MSEGGAPPSVYHEKQVRQMCALHVLNNLFQDPQAFTKADLDGICNELDPESWINPHKSAMGLGNYDVNVIMMALQTRGFKAVWFDKRKSVEALHLETVYGLIINLPSDFKLLGLLPTPFTSKHWIAIKALDGHFFNLDSKLENPIKIGQLSDVIQYLKNQLKEPSRELLVVVPDAMQSIYRGGTVD